MNNTDPSYPFMEEYGMYMSGIHSILGFIVLVAALIRYRKCEKDKIST